MVFERAEECLKQKRNRGRSLISETPLAVAPPNIIRR